MLQLKVSNQPRLLVFFLLFWWHLLFSMANADTFIPYGKPTIDGEFAAGEWPDLSHIRMARFYGFDQFADFWLQWDNDYLYIAGRLDDFTPHEENAQRDPNHCHTWTDDSIEIYLHPSANLPANNGVLNELSRILAFTMTGLCQRLDRGESSKYPQEAPTTGLEDFGNTTAVIGNDKGNNVLFFNKPLGQQPWACPDKLPSQPVPHPQIIFQSKVVDKIEWRFEVALPWELVDLRDTNKIVGGNCAVGQGKVPTRLPPKDGLSLRMNFYRINDDDGGDAKPHEEGIMMEDALGNKSSNGIQKNEWFVYQGDRFHPAEWATFVLSDQRRPNVNEVPKLEGNLTPQTAVSNADNRRVHLKFRAPSRATGGSVSRYIVHVQEGGGGVDEARWNSMMPEFAQAYQPLPPGTEQEIDVIGLSPGKTYTIALRAIDEVNRQSNILSTVAILPNSNTEPFITVSPTGRSLVLTDYRPFVVVGETGLMPWLPLRGLYDGELCDEHPSDFLKNPPSDFKQPIPASCGNGAFDKSGNPIDGRTRNYHNEKIFYRCELPSGKLCNGELCEVALLEPSDTDASDNCQDVYKESPIRTESIEGEQVAIDYFAKLKANGVNVLTVFVESLDLNATPIFLEPSPGQANPTVLKFLDRLIDLAKKNDVYLLLRLYDTFYYKDNGYQKLPNLGRKWSDTYWFKEKQKSSPEGFFDGDLDEFHKNRMKSLLEHYRDEPHILGWDLVNEIDNKVRFNEAGYQARKRWVEEMVRFAKTIDPNHLVFYSFLTWDPKDADYYRTLINTPIPTTKDVMKPEKYIGMDAAFAYRLPGVELAVPHAYYAHVANPWSPHIPDYAPPLEIARGITYGFYQIRDGRPILDGESSPNGHLYERIYGQDGFTEGQDDKDFMNGAWLHFAAGGAGANLRWPADLRPSNFRNTVNQITDVKRTFLKTFKENVGDILWQGDRLQVSTRKLADDLVQITRHDERSAVVYLYNQTGNPIHEVTLSDLPKAEAGEIKVINPAQAANNVLFNQSKVFVGAGRPSIKLNRPTDNAAVIVSNMVLEAKPTPPTPSGKNSDGIIADQVWIKATIKIPGIPDSEALWHFGGDEAKNGNRAVWGYFYANPNVFDWGDENNPEVFVKVWFDASGRIDVNFFHVSGPDIEVLSGLKNMTTGQANTATQAKRYARHTYGQGNPASELLNTPEVPFGKADANPKHNPVSVQASQIGAVIQTADKGAIDAAWHFGGASTTRGGQQVAWGFFYANPNDVSWGFENNPDVYVKVWYDVADKRVDVNFFHVSVPDIRVYSGFSDGNYDDGSKVTTGERYTRHVYKR